LWVKKWYCNLLDDRTYHYRFKGICQDVIDKQSKDFDGLLQLYECFYHETEIEFDLCDNDIPSILVNRVKKPSSGHILLSRFVKH
jgi:hypothetical protein